MNTNIISTDVIFSGPYEIGHFNVIGRTLNSSQIIIGNDFKIGSFSKVEDKVHIGDNCYIGDYCGIYYLSEIGNNVIIEHGSRIYSYCKIGNNVVINGNVSQRVIIEDDVRFFGRIAHSHRNHTLDWKKTIEPSPVSRKGCFIGINSLIVGNVEIGENAYISAGEIVRTNIPKESVLYKGKIYSKSFFKGFIK